MKLRITETEIVRETWMVLNMGVRVWWNAAKEFFIEDGRVSEEFEKFGIAYYVLGFCDIMGNQLGGDFLVAGGSERTERESFGICNLVYKFCVDK